MKAILDTVQALVGRRPNTVKEVRAELISFLKSKDADDLVLDDDLDTLFEMCAIYSDIPTEQIITKELTKQLHQSPLYKRSGPRLIPLQRQTDQKLIEKFAQHVIAIHPDLHYTFKQHGISFIDEVNVVFSFEQIRSIKSMRSELSGALVFPRIKTKEDRDVLIPQNYLEDKKWVFKTLRNRYSRLEGRYFTTTELLDLLTNREIVTHGNYR